MLFRPDYIWAISLWQPWASLLFTEPRTKVHETRHWPIPAHIRDQRVLTHAAQKRIGPLHPDLERLCVNVLGENWREAVPYGAAVGTLVMTGCRSTNAFQGDDAADLLAGDYSPNRYAWATAEPIHFTAPVPMIGRQGWWKVPATDIAWAA